MNKSINHILITGSHRSGTTWVGKTISAHPGIRYVHEPFNVDYPNRKMGLKLDKWFEHYESSARQEDIKRVFGKFLKAGSLEYACYVSKISGGGFIKHLLRGLAQPQVLIKDPIALLSAGWLYETYDLKVICMIRTPLGFVGSLKKANWDFEFKNLAEQKDLMKGMLAPFSDEINEMAQDGGDFVDRVSLLWNVLHSVILEYQQKYPSWLFVKYEDVAENPELGFKKIFDYLGLEVSRGVRAHIEEYTSSSNPKETSSEDYQPRDSKGSLDTWKERLTPEEISRVKSATQEIAGKFYDGKQQFG